jgi:hypothetical protein
VVNDMKELDTDKEDPEAGVYIPKSGQLVVAQKYSSDGRITIGHELMHYFDLSGMAPMSGNFDTVDQQEHAYTNDYDTKAYENTPTSIDGWHNVSELYSNVNENEDVADVGQNIMLNRPNLKLENSPLGEKQEVIIFEMEKIFPGFTASLLLRSHIDTSFNNRGKFNTLELVVGDKNKPLGIGGGLLLLMAASAEAAAWRRRRVVLSLRPTEKTKISR